MTIIVSEFISLDGVVQAPGGADEDTDGGFKHGGWSMPFFDPESMGPLLGALLDETDALLFGRRTWQIMAGAWPGRAGDRFADRMNALPKYVVSNSLTAADLAWANTTLLDGTDFLSNVRALRQKDDKVIQVMGSATLASTLIAHDMVDEYRLMIEPITLGGGKRLFPDDGRARPLDLIASSTASTGVHMMTYRPRANEGN